MMCATAGLLATRLINPNQTFGVNNRLLQSSNCTPKQQKAIENSKKALVYSGIVTGAGVGAACLGRALTACAPPLGQLTLYLGGTAVALGTAAVAVSDIVNRVEKDRC